MKIKTAVLWWLLNNREHDSVKEEDRTIAALMPLVAALFPGINYYSMSGFSQVMHGFAIPVLKKRHPELLTATAEKIEPGAVTEVAVALPSEGYEWQDSEEWRSEFEKLLAAA